jgi:PTS system ascorbate-specific IIA component
MAKRMGIKILLVTHPGIGRAVLHTATRIVGKLSLPVQCVEVPLDSTAESIEQQINRRIMSSEQSGGILILTDLYAATPHNIAKRSLATGAVAILAGLNVSMLLRVFNYADETELAVLYQKAKEGAIRGIC